MSNSGVGYNPKDGCQFPAVYHLPGQSTQAKWVWEEERAKAERERREANRPFGSTPKFSAPAAVVCGDLADMAPPHRLDDAGSNEDEDEDMEVDDSEWR